MADEARRRVLDSLLSLSMPAEEARARLAAFPWDYDEDLVTVTRADALRVLDALASGSLDASQAVGWADVLDARDDVGYEDDEVRELVFELSTPELTGAPAPRWVEAWRARLRA